MDVVGCRLAVRTARTPCAAIGPAARKLPFSARPQSGLALLAQVLDRANIDASTLVVQARLPGAATDVKISITPYAVTYGALLRPWTSLMGAIRFAVAFTDGGGAAGAVAVPATPSVPSAVGPAIPVGLPGLALEGPSFRQQPLEATFQVSSGAVKRLSWRTAAAVASKLGVKVRVASSARRRPSVTSAISDIASLCILKTSTILPAGSAVVPAIEVLGRLAPIRYKRPTVWLAIVRLG